MPSKSAAQHRLMEAAAHTEGGYDGVPESVGKDFVAADKRRAHMQRRRSQGVTYRDLGDEFGMSKSHAHRTVKGD